MDEDRLPRIAVCGSQMAGSRPSTLRTTVRPLLRHLASADVLHRHPPHAVGLSTPQDHAAHLDVGPVTPARPTDLGTLHPHSRKICMPLGTKRPNRHLRQWTHRPRHPEQRVPPYDRVLATTVKDRIGGVVKNP